MRSGMIRSADRERIWQKMMLQGDIEGIVLQLLSELSDLAVAP